MPGVLAEVKREDSRDFRPWPAVFLEAVAKHPDGTIALIKTLGISTSTFYGMVRGNAPAHRRIRDRLCEVLGLQETDMPEGIPRVVRNYPPDWPNQQDELMRAGLRFMADLRWYHTCPSSDHPGHATRVANHAQRVQAGLRAERRQLAEGA